MRQNGRFAQFKDGLLRVSRSFDRARLPIGFAILGAALVGLFFWNIAAGSVSLSFAEVADGKFDVRTDMTTVCTYQD